MHPGVIEKMLVNEKYMGDALMQKPYTVDFLTKKRVMNNVIVLQYYIEDNHKAIIPKELFYKVQKKKHKEPALTNRQLQEKQTSLKRRKVSLTPNTH